MDTYTYNRRKAYYYALRWAYRRNPLFIDFAGLGGDCTNFVSQCIFAGCCTMNFTETFGWYYRGVDDRAPAWTGVEFLYNFLTTNEGEGPYGVETPPMDTQTGDVIQLRNSEGDFYHTLLVVGFDGNEPLVAAHTNDGFNRPLSTYTYETARGIHISGYRSDVLPCDCFDGLYSGREIVFC